MEQGAVKQEKLEPELSGAVAAEHHLRVQKGLSFMDSKAL